MLREYTNYEIMFFVSVNELQEINIEEENFSRTQLEKLTGGYTVPQIVINDKSIGGYDKLLYLHQNFHA